MPHTIRRGPHWRKRRRTPDAVQLATAITASATYFRTNDARPKVVADVQVLVLDDLTP
ncbi:MAG TPA: hypothetical protein VKQ30_00880 [Ktedonobacterales bacterium]|nr:hypothetical protein [Ktedonobacterales bacterium]